jgi:REP element-mobilizing transposase RayT
MSNHFHILVEIPERPAIDPTDEELLAHMKVLYSGRRMREIRWQLEEYRRQENHTAAEEYRQQFLRRMWDLSAFMQSVKQRFSSWYNSREGRDGFLWSERFKSVLVEDGHAARVMAAYIDLNPVRAGIVKRPEDYRWCGYAEAVAGRRKAREGLKWLMAEKLRTRMSDEEAAKEAGEWRKVLEDYGRFMAGDEDRRHKTEDARGKKAREEKKSRGFRSRAVPHLLSEARMLRCRVRYFTDGLVLGTKEFVDGAFRLTRERFGPRRTSGARKLARAETELRTMRALRVDAYGGG